MRPIILNRFGDTLLEYPKSPVFCGPISEADHEADHEADEKKKISTCVGIHAVCGSWIDFNEISDTHNALCCRSCNLRFVYPNRVKTFGDLRKYCTGL